MAQTETGAQIQSCPRCGAQVDTTNAEPLSRIACPQCGEKLRVDRAFDNYVLVETLGVGGMGSVYKARDTLLDRFVALKILRKDADVGHTAELRQEARITASVNHPHVVRVFSSGIDHGQFYLVMELVDHGSLDDLIEEKKQLSETQVLEAGIQIAKGLEAAHQVGLIHRDVKPANILFADAETAKIVDFGLAGVAEPKAGNQGAIWGTPYYVAPERLNNEPEDFRSDIYSLGATLFHALAGRPPIEAETNSASKLRELKNQPIDLRAAAPHVSRTTTRIINRMLAPDPAARFHSYADLIADLQSATGTSAGTKRRNWLIAGAGLILVAVVAGFLFMTGRIGEQPAPAQPTGKAIEQSKALTQGYDNARRQLIEGKYEAAGNAFAALAKEANNQQPVLNWIRLHEGLAAILQRQPERARESFQAVAKDGFVPKREEPTLPGFFSETAQRMMSAEPVQASVTKGQNLNSVYAFAALLFGLKDFELGNFSGATALLEQFVAAQPGAPYTWITDYRPLAQKYLDDLRLYNAWKEGSKTLTTREQLGAALANLRGIESRLQTRSSLAERVKSDATALAGQLSAKEKAENEVREREREALLGKEGPAWTAALDSYRQQVALYNFGAARDAVARPQLSEASLKQEQENTKQKAQWLIEWKARLIEDINRNTFPGPIVDVVGNQYTVPIVRSSEQRFSLKMPYGTIELDWVKLTPQMLLTISSSFIIGKTPEAADRQWLCAIFANETGQTDAARQLGRAAADAKPAYRAQLSAIAEAPSGR